MVPNPSPRAGGDQDPSPTVRLSPHFSFCSTGSGSIHRGQGRLRHVLGREGGRRSSQLTCPEIGLVSAPLTAWWHRCGGYNLLGLCGRSGGAGADEGSVSGLGWLPQSVLCEAGA